MEKKRQPLITMTCISQQWILDRSAPICIDDIHSISVRGVLCTKAKVYVSAMEEQNPHALVECRLINAPDAKVNVLTISNNFI